MAYLVLFGIIAGVTFASPWWLGSPQAMAWTVAGMALALPVAWGVGKIPRLRGPLGVGAGVLLIHLAAAGAGVAGGLPWIELFKFAIQGALLGAAAGYRSARGSLSPSLIVATVSAPLILAALARQQVGLEEREGGRLQGVLAEAISRGTAYPDKDSIGGRARVWVIDRATARIVAAPDGSSGDLDALGLEHPGRILTERGGAFATRRREHGVVAWRAVPAPNDVGVVVTIYEPTRDFDAPLAWTLLELIVVAGMAGVLARKG